MTNPWGITERQAEVLEALAKGNSAKQLARLFGVTTKCIEGRVARIHARMQMHSTMQCVVAWDRHVRRAPAAGQ